jgi:hypothetical protein
MRKSTRLGVHFVYKLEFCRHVYQSLGLDKLEHEAIAAITQLGHVEIPSIVGAAETRKKLLNHLPALFI